MNAVRLLLCALLLLAGCRGAEPGVYWGFERMIEQPRYPAYGKNPLFADGRAMRTPPEGTVPRDEYPGDSLVTEGMEGGGYTERVPLQMTRELMTLGRHRFEIYCAPCHGVAGDAASPVATSMQLRPPPSLHLPRIRALPAGRLYQIIVDGYGLMPTYRDLLSLEERWAVVAYVQALQLSQHALVAELPEAVRADVLRELARAGTASGEGHGEEGELDGTGEAAPLDEAGRRNGEGGP